MACLTLAAGRRVCALAVLALIGCTDSEPEAAAGSGAVTGGEILSFYSVVAYSKLAAGPVVIGRVILDGAEQGCATLANAAGSESLEWRQRTNPDSSKFPVTVCETLMPSGAERIPIEVRGSTALKTLSLPALSSTPTTVAVIGDTGCRESCTPSNWPFPQIAETIATTMAPDLVVHVGDYNYRGTPSHIGDSGDAYDGCTGDTINVTEEDGWKTWNKDFFTPAADLLMSTPWVISRGNHELCSRAGTGFFYLLAPFSPLLGTEPYHCGSHQHQEAVTSSLACPNGGGGSPSVYYVTTEPYLLDLGNLQLAMVDTANACDLPCESFNLETLSANFSTVHGLTKGPTWLVSHRPLWGVKEEDTDEADSSREPEWINQTLEVALADSTLKGYENINLLLAGHIHLFESVTFDDSTPPQLIVGNGGVELESHPPPSGTTPPPPPPAGNFFSKEEHGFLILEVASAGEWSGTLYDPSGNEMAKCAGGGCS